jgi:hypothetical protein
MARASLRYAETALLISYMTWTLMVVDILGAWIIDRAVYFRAICIQEWLAGSSVYGRRHVDNAAASGCRLVVAPRE